MSVQLMFGPVVYIRRLLSPVMLLLAANALSEGMSEHLWGKDILVDVVLGASLDTTSLHTKDSLVGGLAGQERIGTETFPVTSTLSDATTIFCLVS
jgi:hypothetical protein